MNDAFPHQLRQIVRVFLDDILVYSGTSGEHVQDVSFVLSKVRDK